MVEITRSHSSNGTPEGDPPSTSPLARTGKGSDASIINLLSAIFDAVAEYKAAVRSKRDAERLNLYNTKLAAAEKRLAAALTDFIGAIVTGTIQIGMGSLSLGLSFKNLGFIRDGASTTQKAKTMSELVQAINTFSDGLSKLLGGMFTYGAEKQRHVAETLEAMAVLIQGLIDELTEEFGDDNDTLRGLLDALKRLADIMRDEAAKITNA